MAEISLHGFDIITGAYSCDSIAMAKIMKTGIWPADCSSSHESSVRSPVLEMIT